jgi:CubicO group peptidase (beta-lactamase class C family)
MTRACLSLLVLITLSCTAPSEKSTPVQQRSNPFDLVSLHVKSRMLLSDDCSAGAALVMRHGKVVYEEYFGREGRADGALPVGPESRFPCYSVSKGFCAALLLSLVSDGTVALDDPVAKYVPYFTGTGLGGKFPRERVTIRMLASHSGGVYGVSRPPKTWPEGVEPFSDVVLESEPGTAFHYNELGMRLLGFTLSKAAGKPYDQLLKERVLEPLGLTGVGWLQPGDSLIHIVETCIGPDSSYVCYSNETSPDPYPGSGLYATVRDIARYAQLYLDRGLAGEKRIFDDKLLEQAWATQPVGRTPDPDYGLLFWLFPKMGAVGFDGAAHAICSILPGRDMLVLMALNQRAGGAGWDFTAEKENLARVGLALDEMLRRTESDTLAPGKMGEVNR